MKFGHILFWLSVEEICYVIYFFINSLSIFFLLQPNPDEEEQRYVPDYEVIELQKEKEAIAAGKLRRK